MALPASQTPPPGPGETARWILVVDDDEATRLAIEEVLVDEGYVVQTAAHGEHALEILRRRGSPPALVVVDLMMPVMDGWGLIGSMRGDGLDDVGVIAMSAGGSGLLATAPVSNDYLPKPVNLDRLLGTVRRFCGPPDAPDWKKQTGTFARDVTIADEPSAG